MKHKPKSKVSSSKNKTMAHKLSKRTGSYAVSYSRNRSSLRLINYSGYLLGEISSQKLGSTIINKDNRTNQFTQKQGSTQQEFMSEVLQLSPVELSYQPSELS